MSRFDEVFNRVIGAEGGYVNDPRDPGGETKYGISKRQYPTEDIKNLTLDRAKEIYRADYWSKIGGDNLPPPIDEFIFDYAVNSGVSKASKALQGACGVLRDGQIGPKTIGAVKDRNPKQMLRLIFVDRAMAWAEDANLKTFGIGWYARLFDKTEQALKEL